MAVRILFVAAVFAALSGCSRANPPPEGAERHEGRERVQPAPRLAPQPSPEPDAGTGEPAFDTQDDLVGEFCRPDNVPAYGVASAVRTGNELMPVVELVVDTKATSEVDLTLIARDLKWSYAFDDALLVSFLDRSRPGEPETGEAQIINAVDGALILGMPEGPPNKEGLTVIAYEDPTAPDEEEVFARTACS
jgi:hypothetical protein